VSFGLVLALLGLCVLGSAIYSGSETGLYSLSRLRVEAEVRNGSRSARLVQRLLHDERGLLLTLLIGNNLMLQLCADLGEDLTTRFGVPPAWRELVLSGLMTPFLFVFAELVPKDLFHRRPHALVGYTAPLVAASKLVFLPLVLVLRGCVLVIEKALRIPAGSQHGSWRESLLDVLGESEAAVTPATESMVQNVLELRSTPVERVMVPWSKVRRLEASESPERQAAALEACPFSRLVVVDGRGAAVGYVHLLEVLGDPARRPPLDHLRPLITLGADLSLDRALARLRAEGQRLAVVGRREAPLGLVTVKDLVEEISGELSRW
jgi:CBS domain containing-hemolysin-like protein